MSAVRIATRSSAQARAQSEHVGRLLAAATGCEWELVLVDTVGDRNTDVPLHQIGGQGVFVKEVQRAVAEGDADIAVHSAKDLTSGDDGPLMLAAFTERRSPQDALVGRRLDELPSGAVVATGSVRRRAQLTALRPDLSFVELRGNIHTRLDKVPDGGAVVMALAALEILGLVERASEVMDVDLMVPMVGQGCVAVECRRDDAALMQSLRAIDHAPTRRAVEAERAFLAELGAGCSAPVAAHLGDDGVLRAFMADGRDVIQVAGEVGDGDDHRLVGAALAVECRRRLRGR